MFYDAEVWEVKDKLQVLHTGALRRSTRISGLQHNVIKQKMKIENDIIDRMEQKKLTYYDQSMYRLRLPERDGPRKY